MESETITTSKMRALETNAEYYGISLLQLMETAGRNIAEEIASRFNSKKTKVTIFCGSGGNGGDGFVAARHLVSLGFSDEIIRRATGHASLEAYRNYVKLDPSSVMRLVDNQAGAKKARGILGKKAAK